MHRIILPLEQNYQRPVIVLSSLNNIRALIDTGARFPVWTAGEMLARRAGAKNLNKRITFGGFGGNTEGFLYTLDVRLGELAFPNMPIIVQNNSPVKIFQMILSAANFDGTIYHIDSIHHQFQIDVPNHQLERKLEIKKEPDHQNYYIEAVL